MEARRTQKTSRVEWQKRVERWKESGLSAEGFAAELGIKPGTLRFWKYSLDKQKRSGGRPTAGEKSLRRRVGASSRSRSAVAVASRSFELELSGDRRLRIPAEFDAAALVRLLALLERR